MPRFSVADGFSAAFFGAAGIALLGGLLAMVTLRSPRSPAPAPGVAGEQAEGEVATVG